MTTWQVGFAKYYPITIPEEWLKNIKNFTFRSFRISIMQSLPCGKHLTHCECKMGITAS